MKIIEKPHTVLLPCLSQSMTVAKISLRCILKAINRILIQIEEMQQLNCNQSVQGCYW